MLALWRKEGGEYNGPNTYRAVKPHLFLPYPEQPVRLAQVGLWLALRMAWRQYWAMRKFKFEVMPSEDLWSMSVRGRGDCKHWSRTLRDALQDLVPQGSLRILFCTTGSAPVTDWNGAPGHDMLALHTVRGVYVVDNLNPRWRPFDAGEHHDWNME